MLQGAATNKSVCLISQHYFVLFNQNPSVYDINLSGRIYLIIHKYYKQRFLMNNYPLKDINREIWQKKVSNTSMYTIPAEDEAFPVLQELNEILSRLITSPIKQTLDQSLIEYFFSSVFPTVCVKIIRSKYFKNPEVLKYSNFVLQKSVCLVALYLDVAIKYPKFLQILVNVFSDEYYFKNNNQLHYMIYPYSYFPNIQKQMTFKVGDFIDVIKIGNLYQKVSWSQGEITEVLETQIQVQYLYDAIDKKVRLKKDSPQIAPFKSKSFTFDWRMSLKIGDLVDVEDSFGSWYNGTVIDIIEKEQGKKNVKVSLKVYHELGNKEDQQGTYYGFNQYEQILDFTSPKLAPFSTVAKLHCYQSTKTTNFDSVEDLNDYQFKQINGQKIYALPRRKFLSKLQFDTINQFGRLGGFDNYMNYLQKQINFDVLCYFVKGISGVTGYLHRELVTNLVDRLKIMVEKYLFGSTQKSSKLFTKQQSEMIFSGLRALQKRLYSTEHVSKYENNIKMSLAESCLQSEAIKNKLIGLNQLKDIFRSVTYSSSQKNKYIKQWVKNNKIFQKVYIINSHVQLIKKSQQFFKYLINENILEVTDLQRLYKLAQKGDFQSRVSLYKLFQEVSHIFKKQHVYFLIDTILQSEQNLILNQDIDLLHELSRFSNYFPLTKVISFFESIILGENKVKQLNDYAIKKYSEIVAKNQQMKPCRRNIIKSFLQKLSTHDISQITKVLKGIFEGIGVGDWGKKDLNQILIQQKIQEVVVETLRKIKDQPQFSKSVTVVLDFLLFIYKISSKLKINIKTLVDIWAIIQGNQQKQNQFYKWANQISKSEQGYQGVNIQQLQTFYRQLFTPQRIRLLQGSQFQLAKIFFVQINKKLRYISVVNTFKQRQVQKQYKRKVQMKLLKLIDIIIQMIYNIQSQAINNLVLNFFIQLYTSKDNSQEQIDQFLNKLLADFKQEYESKNYPMLGQTIKLIEVVINDSQKNVQTRINSLISKKQSDSNKFIIINEVNYVSIDSQKKSQLVLPMNTTIIKLRKILAKQFNLTWQQIKIVSNKQIQDYQNSRTFKEIKLNPNQPLTISRRMVGSQPQQELIINDQLNPKAVRCFKVIFQKYSTNGRMDKSQCTNFTTVCLGSTCTPKFFNEKIANLYTKYDDDHDELLTFQNFLKFYQDAAKDRAHTVWSNLRSFQVKGDFKFTYEPEQLIQVTKYPRNIIAQYPKVYDILFDLLHIKQVASVAFQLLERLPVSKAIQQQLLNIQSQQDLQKILSTPDMYQLSYKMNIIQYLAHSNQLQTQAQKKWHNKFIQLQGYQLLYNCLQNNINRSSQVNKQQGNEIFQNVNIIQDITQTSLNLLNQYWLECFSGDPTKVRLSLSFISADQDMDDKLDYLIFGRFFKSDKKLQPKPSKLPSQANLYIWRGIQKPKIKQFLVQEFNKKWSQATIGGKSSQKDEKKYNFFNLLAKIIDSLNILCMNQNPQEIISIMQNILEKIPSMDIIKRFYCFILCQCFFTAQTQFQGAYIRQLFKNLAKGSLTSEHFRVLAALVSRFGISNTRNEGEQSNQITSKLKQVLFNNILNNVNELTVEGCAKLLTHFNLQQTKFQILQKIWNDLLFNPYSLIQKEQSKAALYDLIIKICNSNEQLANKIIQIALKTLNKYIKNLKIVYCNQFKQRSATGYAGMKNLGSTCYINSMMQQLFMNKNFRYCLLRADDGQQPNFVQTIDNKNESRIVDDNFLHQVQRIFASLQLTNRIDFAPRDFCVAYKPFGQSVNVIMQQDVQQFVSMFFDRLQACLSKTVFKKLVSDFYLGKTTNLFKCHSCNQTKKVEQTFHSITLQVKTSKTLDESFNRFQHGQMITDYRCQFCNNKVDVTKMTRISSPPKILIIQLQRIVFNLDTFINEKITTKHSFPHQFNLYQSTLDCYEGIGKSTGMEIPPEYIYQLIGIICHNGTADSGHYISYIKTNQNKWIQFNDSQVTTFNPSNIESQCFGGYLSSSAYDDDYFEQKKQSSKSAYVLLYEKKGANVIQLVLNKQLEKCKNQKQRQKLKQAVLKTLDLQEVITKINNNKSKQSCGQQGKMSQGQNIDTSTPNMQSHQQSSSAPDDSQKQATKLLQEKQIQIRRHQSEDNIQTNIKQQPRMIQKTQQTQAQKVNQNNQQQKDVIIHIKDPVSPFIPEKLRQQIVQDNQIHFFQKCFSSASFVKFFAQILSKATKSYDEILPVCKKLTFGFWLKSPAFKDLLNMIDKILKQQPQGFQDIVTNNPAIISLLIQSSDSQIRSSMATFLSKVIADTVQAKGISIKQNNQDPIFQFLDNLLSLLPSTVSKCWTKFGQYFQFWYQLSTKNQVLVEYMISREIIKHFMDYFLDTKSPLKIYCQKREHQIGSSYANPNFSMLLKCVFSLLQQRMIINLKTQDKSRHLSSNPDQQKLLMSFQSLQKLISDNYENIAAQLIKQICPNNLPATEKAAIVIMKGLSKSNSQNVQPYLQVLHQFVLINDQYQDLRIKWLIGKQTLTISNQNLKLIALNNYSLDEKLYSYDSSFSIQNGCSLLDPILSYYRRIQTFALLCTRQVLKLCEVNVKIRKYISSLSGPTLVYASFTDFLKAFVEKYFDDHKKSYGFYSSSVGFNRQQLGKQVKELGERIWKTFQQDQKQLRKQQLSNLQQVQPNKPQPQQQKGQIKNQDDNNKQANTGLSTSINQQPLNQQHIIQFTQVSSEEKATKQFQIVESEYPSLYLDPNSKEQQKINEQDENVKNLVPKNSSQKQTKIQLQQQIYTKDVYKKSSGKSSSNYANYDEDDDWGYEDIKPQEQTKNTKSSSKRGNRTRGRDNQQYTITVTQQKNQKTLVYSQEEDEQPLMKTKQNYHQKQKQKQKQCIIKDYKQCWHPVKFQYIQIGKYPTDEKLYNIKIEQHQSEVTYLLTKPTGQTNRSFANVGGAQKNFDRILQSAWKNKKKVKVHGYLVKNTSSRDGIRIQTEDGCMFCRAGQNLLLWCDKIIRIWQSQRCLDWPKWKIYQNETKQK